MIWARAYIGNVVTQHPRRKERFYDFRARGMISKIPAASLFQSILGELLIGGVQPFRSRGIVWEKEQEQQGADECDYAFNDEEPPEAVSS